MKFDIEWWWSHCEPFLGSGPEGGGALYNREYFVSMSVHPYVCSPTKLQGPLARPQEPPARPLEPPASVLKHIQWHRFACTQPMASVLLRADIQTEWKCRLADIHFEMDGPKNGSMEGQTDRQTYRRKQSRIEIFFLWELLQVWWIFVMEVCFCV